MNYALTFIEIIEEINMGMSKADISDRFINF